MKPTHFLFALASILANAPALLAQEAPAPGRLQVAPAVNKMPAAEPEVTLIPEQIPETPKPVAVPQPKGEKKSRTEENAEELQTRIHFREARIKALRDPKVQAEWDRAMKAKTDLGRREALKTYYKLLHARIVAVDPSVKKVSDLRQTASLRRLEQTRIDPTEPLDAQDRAEQFARGE